MPFQSGKNQISLFGAKVTNVIGKAECTMHNSNVEVNDRLAFRFLLSGIDRVDVWHLLLHAGSSDVITLFKNQLPPFQAIPVKPKLTFSIPGHSSQVKTDFLHSKPFQSG
jgi:hypothetical protein